MSKISFAGRLPPPHVEVHGLLKNDGAPVSVTRRDAVESARNAQSDHTHEFVLRHCAKPFEKLAVEMGKRCARPPSRTPANHRTHDPVQCGESALRMGRATLRGHAKPPAGAGAPSRGKARGLLARPAGKAEDT